MNDGFFIGLDLFSVFLASCTQVILKKSAMNHAVSGISYFLNPATITAYGLFFLCTMLTFYCLQTLPVITVNMLECSAYVYILLFDYFFFGKKITLRKVIGNVMIIAGIVICLH
jgi:drug/metabolite transporter (DMT)-like permease